MKAHLAKWTMTILMESWLGLAATGSLDAGGKLTAGTLIIVR